MKHNEKKKRKKIKAISHFVRLDADFWPGGGFTLTT